MGMLVKIYLYLDILTISYKHLKKNGSMRYRLSSIYSLRPKSCIVLLCRIPQCPFFHSQYMKAIACENIQHVGAVVV